MFSIGLCYFCTNPLVIFFNRRYLHLPPFQGQKHWGGWNASQGQSMVGQHYGEAASAVEKSGRGVRTCDASAAATTNKLSQCRTIMCSNTGIQASCRQLLLSVRLKATDGKPFSERSCRLPPGSDGESIPRLSCSEVSMLGHCFLALTLWL